MASTGTQPEAAIAPQDSAAAAAARRRRWADLGLVLLVGIAPIVLSGISQWFIPIAGTAQRTNMGFSSGLLHEGTTLILFVTLLRRQGRSLKDIGLTFHWLDLPKAAGLFALSYTGMLVVFGVIQYAHIFWTRSPLPSRDPREIFASPSTVLLILYILAAPIFEETLVRGYLMTELIGLSWPVWLATVASVLLQTSYHLYYGVVGALSVGVGFAVSAIYFARSRRLMPVLLSHFLWDLTATYLNWHR